MMSQVLQNQKDPTAVDKYGNSLSLYDIVVFESQPFTSNDHDENESYKRLIGCPGLIFYQNPDVYQGKKLFWHYRSMINIIVLYKNENGEYWHSDNGYPTKSVVKIDANSELYSLFIPKIAPIGKDADKSCIWNYDYIESVLYRNGLQL